MTGQEKFRSLYAQKKFPVFQNKMYRTREDAMQCPRGDISLVEDLTTGLVRNAAFDPALVEYDADYQNEQANSEPFRRHLDWVAGLVAERMGLDNLIEVGCGKGRFLELLSENGASITGFDPTYEGDSPLVRKCLFEPGLGLSAKGLILRHVLEHIPDPATFIGHLRDANGGSGLIYIEVPCFDWICENRAWYDIFYEHVNYFRLSDFDRMFGTVVDSGRCFGGQYLYVVAEISTIMQPVYDPEDTVDFPDDLMQTLENAARGTQAHEDIIWGGASKGVIYALLRERANAPVDAAIDINPAKQGRYMAGTGLRISAPEDILPNLSSSSRIFVMNPNYFEEIREMSNNAYTYLKV